VRNQYEVEKAKKKLVKLRKRSNGSGRSSASKLKKAKKKLNNKNSQTIDPVVERTNESDSHFKHAEYEVLQTT